MEEPVRMRAPRGGGGVRMLSRRPTTSVDPFASPPPPGVPRWLILDRFVHLSNNSRLRGVVPRDATASALAHDCAGRPVRASLRIADPPAVCRLYLQQTARPPINNFRDPQVIAAHRNSILFRLTVPFKDDSWWHQTVCFPDDYFVYSCRPSSPPSLTRLPACFEGGTTCPKRDKRYLPYRSQQLRAMLEEEIGILSHGEEGEFTVAQLNFSGPDEFELCVLHHPPYASATSTEWSVHKVQKPPNMTTSAYSWRTDVVMPIGRCLCWVDYYQGLLLVDVTVRNADHQQWIHYIPLPFDAMSTRPYRDGGVPDPLRCVSVTDAGVIKLVCILTDEDHPLPCPFVIQTWTLGHDQWTLDDNVTMDAVGFFRVLGAAHSCLPRVQPSFPLVSLDDPDVLCFLLNDLPSGLNWMIEVNMRNKQLQSSTLYINEEEEEAAGGGYPPKRGCMNDFFGHQFIPSKFSSYLSEDAITSRKLSETMQKAKEERVLQNSRLQTRLKKQTQWKK